MRVTGRVAGRWDGEWGGFGRGNFLRELGKKESLGDQ